MDEGANRGALDDGDELQAPVAADPRSSAARRIRRPDAPPIRVVRTVEHVQELHSGPLPSAKYFERVEAVIPGAGNRIIVMTELVLDDQVEEAKFKRDLQLRGLNYAFALAVLILMIGLILVETGKSVAGYATLTTAAVGLVALFASPYVGRRTTKVRDDDEHTAES